MSQRPQAIAAANSGAWRLHTRGGCAAPPFRAPTLIINRAARPATTNSAAWQQAFTEALEHDEWGQLEEAASTYQRLQIAAAAVRLRRRVHAAARLRLLAAGGSSPGLCAYALTPPPRARRRLRAGA